jgi:hypothetical protein
VSPIVDENVLADITVYLLEVSPVTKTGTSASEDTPTRRKLSYGGNDYRRTRGGNLVQSKR